MAEESIIKRKLLLDGEGTGEDKKLHVFLKQLTKWVYCPSNCDITYNNLLSQLQSVSQARRKFDLVVRANAKQISMFQTIHSTFEERTALIREDITKQLGLLKRARVVKKHRMDYDLLVQMVKREPCRKKMKTDIDQLREEIMLLEDQREELSGQLNAKVKQCYVLSTSANALKCIMAQDNAIQDSEVMSIESE